MPKPKKFKVTLSCLLQYLKVTNDHTSILCILHLEQFTLESAANLQSKCIQSEYKQC